MIYIFFNCREMNRDAISHASESSDASRRSGAFCSIEHRPSQAIASVQLHHNREDFRANRTTCKPVRALSGSEIRMNPLLINSSPRESARSWNKREATTRRRRTKENKAGNVQARFESAVLISVGDLNRTSRVKKKLFAAIIFNRRRAFRKSRLAEKLP